MRRHVTTDSPDTDVRRSVTHVPDDKPEKFAALPEVVAVFEWTRRLAAAKGWRRPGAGRRAGSTVGGLPETIERLQLLFGTVQDLDEVTAQVPAGTCRLASASSASTGALVPAPATPTSDAPGGHRCRR
jgi:hypothetical protein